MHLSLGRLLKNHRLQHRKQRKDLIKPTRYGKWVKNSSLTNILETLSSTIEWKLRGDHGQPFIIIVNANHNHNSSQNISFAF
ncbi:hypothetical protein E2C01_043178 [Portunus trituberculatus]|uniref:Uncharacterized protein n=1 Tax=Portunus trituberculatus TaxID=210409 RepID=A0A5B7FVM0_PORTR|nr:hypothetical protein [Portunus trituberculatus]